MRRSSWSSRKNKTLIIDSKVYRVIGKRHSSITQPAALQNYSVQLEMRSLLATIIEQVVLFKNLAEIHYKKMEDLLQQQLEAVMPFTFQSPQYLALPAPACCEEPQPQEQRRVKKNPGEEMLCNTTEMEEKEKKMEYSPNPKEIISKLKRQHQKSKLKKQNVGLVKLNLVENDDDSNYFDRQESLRLFKKYADELEQIPKQLKQQKITTSEGNEEFFLDSNAKPIKLRKNESIKMSKYSHSKPPMNAQVLDKVKLHQQMREIINLPKRVSSIRDQNSENLSFCFSKATPTVEQLQTSIAMTLRVSKGVRVRQQTHASLYSKKRESCTKLPKLSQDSL